MDRGWALKLCLLGFLNFLLIYLNPESWKVCFGLILTNVHFPFFKQRQPLIPPTHQRGIVLHFHTAVSQTGVNTHNQSPLLVWKIPLIGFSLLSWFGAVLTWSHFERKFCLEYKTRSANCAQSYLLCNCCITFTLAVLSSVGGQKVFVGFVSACFSTSTLHVPPHSQRGRLTLPCECLCS